MEFKRIDLDNSGIVELANLVFYGKIYYFDTKECNTLCKVTKFQYIREDDELSFGSECGDTLYIKIGEAELDKIELYMLK